MTESSKSSSAAASQQSGTLAVKTPLFQTWKFWSAVLLIVTIGALSYYYEDVKDQFPWLISLQLWTYGKMSHAQARASRPKWVVGIEVDNPTFYGEMERTGPNDITDRAYLAQIVNRAVEANAAVIALDINLVREGGAEPTADDKLLWQAIQNATEAHVAVVLTIGLQEMRPLQNIIGPDALAVCAESQADGDTVRAGFDHGPKDLRKVPLVVDARSPDGHTELACRSFALQIVDAYEQSVGISPKTVDRLAPTIEKRQFAYSMFLPRKAFPHVSAAQVYKGNPASLDMLHHRIVIIGGNRSSWRTEDPDPPIDGMLDYRQGPEGQMAGMYFHATYVEGLLDDRIQSTIPRWLAALIDMLLATAIIVAIGKWEESQPMLMVLAVTLLILVPIVIAYVAMITLGYCFDFILPVILSLLHPALERYVDIPEHFMKLLGRKSNA